MAGFKSTGSSPAGCFAKVKNHQTQVKINRWATPLNNVPFSLGVVSWIGLRVEVRSDYIIKIFSGGISRRPRRAAGI